MSAIFQQLKSYQIHFPADDSEGNAEYHEVNIAVVIARAKDDIARLIEDHKWLSVQYSAHCAQLMKNLREADADVIEQIEVALRMSALLEHLYTIYLYETDAINLMHRHQHIYRQLMRDRGKNIAVSFNPDDKPSISKMIHDLFTTANRRRLYTVRLRRLLIAVTPMVIQFETYCLLVRAMEQWTSSLVSYLAWLTLFPRLSKNLFLMGKHLIPNRWMSAEEYALGLTTRFVAQFELHWFELANDIATVSVGLLNCFVLTGSVNIYLGFSLFVFDVALAALRAYIDISYLKKLESQYNVMSDKTSIDEGYLVHLRQRIAYEEDRLGIMVKNTLGLLIAAAFSLPILAVNPVFPLIGALIAVLTTILNMIATQRIEQQKPDDKISYIPQAKGNRFALFQPPIQDDMSKNLETENTLILR